jgi:hypothetical protein
VKSEVVDLAVAFGRSRLSPRTGFLHYSAQDEAGLDTIPVFENACFALALCKQKTAETILTAKDIIARLLPFQTVEGNFPTYLHEYPKTWDPCLALKIAPVFMMLLQEFGHVLDTSFKAEVTKSVERALSYAEQQRYVDPIWINRLAACRHKRETCLVTTDRGMFFESLITRQLAMHEQTLHGVRYNRSLQLLCVGPYTQTKGHLTSSALEMVLAHATPLVARHKTPQREHLLAALILPCATDTVSDSPIEIIVDGSLHVFWQGADSMHHLTAPQSTHWAQIDEMTLQLTVPAGESYVFVDWALDISIFVEGKKGTLFAIHNQLTIHSSSLAIEIRFEQASGYCGHITRGNRPLQTEAKGARLYEAYDWKLFLNPVCG